MTSKTYTKEEQKANRELWAQALESGEYKQTRGKLKARNGAMCCLGVLSELAGCEWTWHDHFKEYGANGKTGIAPSAAMDFVGLQDDSGEFYKDGFYSQLSDINDEGTPFSEIAQIIRDEPEGLFND